MAGDYRDSFWGGSLEGFDVAAAASKRGWSAFKELADSIQGSRTSMEEHVKEGQRMSRDHMAKDAGINSPFFDAVFVAKEKQAAAAAACIEKLKGLEDRARNETGKKDLEAFVKGAMTPQLANTVRLDQRKMQSGKKGKEDKNAGKMEKLKLDTQRFEEAHVSEIQQLEGMERLSAKEMRELLRSYVESQQTYHTQCMEALAMLESSVEGLTEEELLAKLTAQIGTGAEKPSDLLAQGIISTSSAAAKNRSSTSLASGASVGKAFGTLRKKGDLLRKKTIDSLHSNTSQTSVRSQHSDRGSARGSSASQTSTRSGAVSALAAAGAAAGWGATHMGSEPDTPQTETNAPAEADSDSYDDEPEDDKPKIMVKIRDETVQQPQQEEAPIRLEMDASQTRRRPQSPATDRRRVRPTSSASDEFNPRSPSLATMPRVAPRSPLTSNTLNKSSSFGTFRPGGQAVPGMQLAVTETCNAYFKGPSLGKVQVLGKIMVSFEKAFVEDLALDDKPFAFRLTNIARLSDITPNAFLLPTAPTVANGASVDDDELVFELLAADLNKCFNNEETIEGVSVAGEQVRATIVSYSVTADSPLKLAPLRMCSTWRCGENMTDVTVDYMHNPQATMKALTDILITVDMKNMNATSCESEPRGRWHKEQLSWAIPQLASGRGRLRGQFEVNEKTQTPSKVTVRFFGTGESLSGIDVASAPDRGSSLGFSRSIVRFLSGVYISDYISAPFSSSTTPLGSKGSLAEMSSTGSTASVAQAFTPPPQRTASPPVRTNVAETINKSSEQTTSEVASSAVDEPTPNPEPELVISPSAQDSATVDRDGPAPLIDTASAPAEDDTDVPIPISSNPEYNHDMDIEMDMDAEPLPSETDDKGKGPAITIEHDPSDSQHERKASTTSQGLPTYDVITSSGPAPALDFEEFLRMTSPRQPRKN